MSATGSPALRNPNSRFSAVQSHRPIFENWKKMRAEWQKRRRYREDLKRLLRVGPYMIADIGLTHEEAQKEIAKPFWLP